MEATTFELRNKLREKGIYVEREEAPRAAINTDPNVNKVMGKAKVVAWKSIFDILPQQEPSGAIPNNRETSFAMSIPSDIILEQRFSVIGGPAPSRREVPADKLWCTALCASYIQEVIAGIGALGAVTTTVEKSLGAISTVEHEVVHEDPVAQIHSIIASMGKTDWLERATAYMMGELSRNPDLKCRTVSDLMELAKNYLHSYIAQKGSTKSRTSAAPKKIPLRSRFYSLQKEKGDPLESFNATKEFQRTQTYNIDFHEWVEEKPNQTTLSAFNYCDGSCGYAHQCPIGRQLGRGAYGMVYGGNFWSTPCAIKSWGSMGADECSLFLSELEIMSKLRHPNVVQLFGASISPPNYCMVMELCEKGDLHDLIHKHKISSTQPFGVLLQICHDAANGLAFMHESGAIHRDVKSSNFLVTSDWIVKCADFTVSAFIPKNEMQISKVPIGTPLYMAPEVFKRMPYNFKADVFSFGVTMCEVLSGKEPHQELVDERGWEPVVNMVCGGLRPTLPSNIPASLSNLIQLCWSADQHSRPSMSEVVKHLEAIAIETRVQLQPRYAVASLNPTSRTEGETAAAKSRAITYSAGTKPQQTSPPVAAGPAPKAARPTSTIIATSPVVERATPAASTHVVQVQKPTPAPVAQQQQSPPQENYHFMTHSERMAAYRATAQQPQSQPQSQPQPTVQQQQPAVQQQQPAVQQQQPAVQQQQPFVQQSPPVQHQTIPQQQYSPVTQHQTIPKQQHSPISQQETIPQQQYSPVTQQEAIPQQQEQQEQQAVPPSLFANGGNSPGIVYQTIVGTVAGDSDGYASASPVMEHNAIPTATDSPQSPSSGDEAAVAGKKKSRSKSFSIKSKKKSGDDADGDQTAASKSGKSKTRREGKEKGDCVVM